MTGFVHPQKLLRNSSAGLANAPTDEALRRGYLDDSCPGRFRRSAVLQQLYDQMAQLNKTARDIMGPL